MLPFVVTKLIMMNAKQNKARESASAVPTKHPHLPRLALVHDALASSSYLYYYVAMRAAIVVILAVLIVR